MSLIRRLTKLEKQPKRSVTRLNLAKLEMLTSMGESEAVARWPQAARVFELLRLAEERQKQG